jgi:hypothetical protein
VAFLAGRPEQAGGEDSGGDSAPDPQAGIPSNGVLESLCEIDRFTDSVQVLG